MAGRDGVTGGQELRPTLVRLPPDLHDAIKAKAAAEERSMAQAIRHALRLYTQAATP
jgi:predicted HicB family RNase H-like nuclease